MGYADIPPMYALSGFDLAQDFSTQQRYVERVSLHAKHLPTYPTHYCTEALAQRPTPCTSPRTRGCPLVFPTLLQTGNLT